MLRRCEDGGGGDFACGHKYLPQRRGGGLKPWIKQHPNISAKGPAPSHAVSATSSCTHAAQFDKLTDQRRLLAHELCSFTGVRREKVIGYWFEKICESLRVLRETLR